MRITAFVLGAFLLVGCVPQQPLVTAGTWSSSGPISRVMGRTTVGIEDSQFEPHIRFLGIEDLFDSGFSPGPGENYRKFFIRSWMNRQTSNVNHQFYWTIMYRDYEWRFYNRINDERARSLRFTAINRNVVTCAGGAQSGICTFSETVGADLDEAVMRAAVRENRSYCVRIFARSGMANDACLTPTMMREQLAATDGRKNPATRRPTTPSPPAPPIS